MAQTSDTGTETEQAPARRRRRRGRELAGLAIGILAGVGITLAWLIPARHHPSAPVAPSTHAPVLVPVAAGQPDPAALDAEWISYSDQSTCADWAGGDGVSAIRLNDTQLAWFFSDTFIGPAGPATGFSNLSGFVHNAVVVQTTTGQEASAQHVRHHDRRRSLHRPRPSRQRGPGRGGTPGRPRRHVRPVLGRGRPRDRRDGGQVLHPLPGPQLPVRPGRHGDRHPAGQPAQRKPATDPSTARSPGRAWSGCRPTPRRPAAPRSCGAPRCCRPGTRCTSTAPRARTSRSPATASTWPASRCPS